MSILVHLRDRSGNVIGQAGEWEGAVPAYFPDFEHETFLTIRYIDPYGNTIFNHLQMAPVIAELHVLREHAKNETQRRMMDGVIGLAEECAKLPQSQLVFIGD